MNAARDMKSARCEFNLKYRHYAQQLADELGLGEVDTVDRSYFGLNTVSRDCNGLQIYVRGEMTQDEYLSGKSDDELYKSKIEKALKNYQLRKSGLPEQDQNRADLKKNGLNFWQTVRSAGNEIWQWL